MTIFLILMKGVGCDRESVQFSGLFLVHCRHTHETGLWSEPPIHIYTNNRRHLVVLHINIDLFLYRKFGRFSDRRSGHNSNRKRRRLGLSDQNQIRSPRWRVHNDILQSESYPIIHCHSIPLDIISDAINNQLISVLLFKSEFYFWAEKMLSLLRSECFFSYFYFECIVMYSYV